MNIMLVPVTERTRKIGVRKALGARRGDILRQFLIEASTISVIGGALGVFFGVLAAKLVSWVTPLPRAVQLWSMLRGLPSRWVLDYFLELIPPPLPPKSLP